MKEDIRVIVGAAGFEVIKHKNGFYVEIEGCNVEEELERLTLLIAKECVRVVRNRSLEVKKKADRYGAEKSEKDTATSVAWHLMILEQEITDRLSWSDE